jgi:hypothetical protein
MRYFSCSTDWCWRRDDVDEEEETSSPAFEDLMRHQNFAAIWEYPPDWPTPGEHHPVRHLPHMMTVEAEDFIFMFRAGTGIIGAGQASGRIRGPIPPGDGRRIRGAGWAAAEWRVPVRWIRWQPHKPCKGFGSPWAFYNGTHRPHLAAVLRHLGLNGEG